MAIPIANGDMEGSMGYNRKPIDPTKSRGPTFAWSPTGCCEPTESRARNKTGTQSISELLRGPALAKSAQRKNNVIDTFCSAYWDSDPLGCYDPTEYDCYNCIAFPPLSWRIRTCDKELGRLRDVSCYHYTRKCDQDVPWMPQTNQCWLWRMCRKCFWNPMYVIHFGVKSTFSIAIENVIQTVTGAHDHCWRL